MSQLHSRGEYGDKLKEKKSAPLLPRKKHTKIRFITKRTNDATFSSKSVGTVSSMSSSVPLSTSSSTSSMSSSVPLSTSSSTPSLSSSVPLYRNLVAPSVGIISAPAFVSRVATMGASSSAHASSIPTSAPSSTHASTSSSMPTSTTSSTSTTNASDSVEENIDIQQGYLLGSKRLDGRLWIGVRDKELFPSGPCSSIIYQIFGERVDPKGYRWATISDETKQLYWDEFEKKCCWDDAKTSSVMFCWEAKAKERHRQYIYKMSASRKKPAYITSEVCTSWVAHWNTEEFKKKSDQNKKNRRRGVADGNALSTHTGGSASHSKIANDLKKRWGHNSGLHELFLYTHTKNHDGETFIVDKAKKFHDDYMGQREELEAIGEEINEDRLFYDVIGGHDRKRRLYGFGSYGKSIGSSMGSFETCNSPDYNAETKAEIDKLKDLVATQREQCVDIQKKYEDVQQKYEDAQQKNVDVQSKFEQQLAQAMFVINTLSEQVKTLINK